MINHGVRQDRTHPLPDLYIASVAHRARNARPERPRVTYTVLALDPESELIGAATASYSLAVGNAVIAIAPDVGAVASQAYTNRRLRSRCIQGLRDGLDPTQVTAKLPEWDEGLRHRQVALIDRTGQTASVTGAGCTAWAGEANEAGMVVIGNLLTGPEVVSAMREAFKSPCAGTIPAERFANRLLETLMAGERAGGDARGRQSAAIQVAQATSAADWPPDFTVDLRADNSRDPLADLGEALALQFTRALDSP